MSKYTIPYLITVAVAAVLVAVGMALSIQPVSASAPLSSAYPSRPGVSPRSDLPEGCALWNLVPSDNVQSLDSYLQGVSAVSADDVWAVGYYQNADFYLQTLTEHWDGTAWTVVDSPNPGAHNNILFGVAAISSSDAWAVGWQASTNIPQPLFLHWDGTAWTDASQVIDRPQVVLFSISAVSANDIWAVGQSCETAMCARHITAAVHYDGTSWSIVDSPNPGIYNNSFSGVMALSANDAWAVGEVCTDPGCGTSQSLIEHWDGTVWTPAASPSPGSSSTNLVSVSAVSPDDAWAVGLGCADALCESAQSVTLHWDGTAWSEVSSPNPGSMDTHLNAVVMSASDDVWAVGSYTNDGSTYSNPVLHWDGTAWSVVPVTNPGSSDNELFGLAKVTANDVWAVGDYSDAAGLYRTQTQHYSGPCATATPTASNTPTDTPTVLPSSTSTPEPPTATATATATATETATSSPMPATATSSPVPPTATETPSATATSMHPTDTRTPVPSATPCVLSFSDVHASDYFYQAVQYLYCHAAISGYSDGTFRPYNTATRGQLAKIVVLAEGWPIDTHGGPHFTDVPSSNPFYSYVETAYNRGVISGYADGTFRWGNDVTRGQIAKIVVNAEGWPIDTRGGPHFTDVPSSDPFYGFIETAYNRGVISGYADHTFRPGNNATRGQISKMVYNAVNQ